MGTISSRFCSMLRVASASLWVEPLLALAEGPSGSLVKNDHGRHGRNIKRLGINYYFLTLLEG